MHSFHHSRGRIFFEVLCALGISASCVLAWDQTGAPALLGAAAIVLLYGLVHVTDLRRPKPLAASVTDVERAIEQPPTVAQPAAEAEPAKKRKPSRKRKAVEQEQVVEAPVSVADTVPPEPEIAEAFEPATVTPLFEPVPFVRQQRTGFGRKAGLAFRR
jgi:hypothetical protein